ncbi:MAG: hypothetical protein KF799_15405 [Bdellovibrionales bacterium]|nr:hypothetical protein [Bdellovibrionales bacterium]
MLILFHLAPAYAAVQCDAKDTAGREKMVERINERYDDFFRYQRHLEERERARDKGRGENKAMLKEHEAKLEKARLEYIKNRRPPPDRRELEKQAEAADKERKQRMELARRCYVEEQNAAEAVLKRGRKIPGNQEFGLDE